LKVKCVICELSNIATLSPTNGGLSLVQQGYITFIESDINGFYIMEEQNLNVLTTKSAF